jgi:hypothetical protein
MIQHLEQWMTLQLGLMLHSSHTLLARGAKRNSKKYCLRREKGGHQIMVAGSSILLVMVPW